MKKITRIDVTTDNSAGSKGLFVMEEKVEGISESPIGNGIQDFDSSYYQNEGGQS